MSLKRIRPPTGGRATIVGDLVFTSGVSWRTRGILKAPGDCKTQIETVLDTLRELLKACGTSFENVIKGTVYLADLNDRERYLNALWQEAFPERPERATYQVGLAPSVAVEIELIAVILKKQP